MQIDTFQYQVTVPQKEVGYCATDNWGDVEWYWHEEIQLWIDEYDVVFKYEVLDKHHNQVIIEFERRGQAAIFMSLFIKEAV